jgi:hypothetical protein
VRAPCLVPPSSVFCVEKRALSCPVTSHTRSHRRVIPVQDKVIRFVKMEAAVEAFMTSQNTPELHEICGRLQHMGYSQSKHIRMYGQEFEVISNPFPDGNGIAVRAIAKRETAERTVRLPLPVLQTVMGKKVA